MFASHKRLFKARHQKVCQKVVGLGLPHTWILSLAGVKEEPKWSVKVSNSKLGKPPRLCPSGRQHHRKACLWTGEVHDIGPSECPSVIEGIEVEVI